jgi:hypothetical protein
MTVGGPNFPKLISTLAHQGIAYPLDVQIRTTCWKCIASWTTTGRSGRLSSPFKDGAKRDFYSGDIFDNET